MNEKISKARTQLVLDHPFFGSLALRLKLVEDQTFATAYTDGKVMGYNPAFIDTLSLAETKWLIAHEVMHLACMHHVRRTESLQDGTRPQIMPLTAFCSRLV